MKPVVSFTLFGTAAKYYAGAFKNISLVEELLPEWEVRIYYHPEMVLENELVRLENTTAKLINVQTYSFEGVQAKEFPYFWRFLTFFEDVPSIARDLDSRISPREVQYINNWIESGKDYFIIRDHPWHSPVPAGLLGFKRRIPAFETHFRNFVQSESLAWGADQEILRKYFYETEGISYEDVYYCGFDNEENYIRRDNKNFFIGIQLDEDDNLASDNAVKSLDFLSELNY